MPLVLINCTSGQTLPPRDRPKRVTLGRVDDRVAAVLAPVAPGWTVVPLRNGVPLEVNRAAVTRPIRVNVGDVLTLGPHRFEVGVCTTPLPETPAPSTPATDSCRVTLRFRGRSVAETSFRWAAVIGTAATCKVRVPAETGLEAQHAVVAHVEDRWHLFVLGKLGATQFGEANSAFALPLVPGESVWLGDVELTARCEAVDPLDRGYGAVPAAPIDPAETLDLPQPLGPLSTANHAAGNAPTAVSGAAVGRPPTVSDVPPAVPRVAAVALCNHLQKLHGKVPPGVAPRAVSADPLPARPSRTVGSVAELTRLGEELEAAPWDPDVLFALAGYLWRMGLGDGGRWVLKELYRQHPNDPVVVESLAALYRGQAADPSLGPADRAAALEQADKYLARAARLRPGEHRLTEARREVGAELTLLRTAGPAAGPAG
jgi:hypothetical protein